MTVCPYGTDTFFYSSEKLRVAERERDAGAADGDEKKKVRPFPITTFRRLIAHTTRLTLSAFIGPGRVRPRVAVAPTSGYSTRLPRVAAIPVPAGTIAKRRVRR